MRAREPIAVTGVGLEIPGGQGSSGMGSAEQPSAFDPARLLGKKGLRYKDRATVLALCASHRALEDRGLLGASPAERARVGVCASSNLGNMDTVCQEAATIHNDHVDRTSPMNLPVGSSNVIPAGIAIRWGFKGPNLMLCNGATSGLDAIRIAALMLRSGRADKMLVVGVEPKNAVTERLLRECNPDHHSGLQCGELAAALVLERWENGPARSPRYGFVGGYGFVPPGGDTDRLPRHADVWFAPSPNSPQSRALVSAMQEGPLAGVPLVDASRGTGEIYGALGVFQVLKALLHLQETGTHRALVSNGFTFGDGLSFLEVTSNSAPAPVA